MFTHLQTVSGYSARYGAAHPAALAQRAAERGMDALALTDRDTVAGIVRFAKASAEAGIRPLFGVDLAVPAYLDSGEPLTAARVRTPVRGGAFVDESAPRAVFLARNRAGWAALEAAATADGLFVLLGPESEPLRALAQGRPDRAQRLLAPWQRLFPGWLRLAAVHHGRPGSGPGSLRLAARTAGFAMELQVPAVLTNQVRYADPDQRELADVLDAARLLTPIDPRRPERLDGGQGWLKDPVDMARLAEQVADAAGQGPGGARALLAATEQTADGCRVDVHEDLGMGTIHFPEAHLVADPRRTPDRVLRSLCDAQMVIRRYDRDRVRWERLQAELRTIRVLWFATYFLTVGQVVVDTRAAGIRVAARGSGAGSFVAHLLGIATADPVEHGLIMERFLSVRRRKMPDIDIDVESARRLEVYRLIMDRFGAARTATLAMPETYRVRHAVRDTGAALSLDPDLVDRLAKAFPHIRARDARSPCPPPTPTLPRRRPGCRTWTATSACRPNSASWAWTPPGTSWTTTAPC